MLPLLKTSETLHRRNRRSAYYQQFSAAELSKLNRLKLDYGDILGKPVEEAYMTDLIQVIINSGITGDIGLIHDPGLRWTL